MSPSPAAQGPQATDLFMVIRLESAHHRRLLKPRLQRLERIYAPMGRSQVVSRWLEDLGVEIVTLGLREGSLDMRRGALTWGHVAAGAAAGAESLLDASAASLRELGTPGGAVSWDPRRVRLVSSGGPLQVLYEAGGEGIEAWSTHAVAAGVAALGRPTVDPLAVGELVGCEFVGGNRTILKGVRALDPGTVVDVTVGQRRLWSCFPALDRWTRIPPREAAPEVEALLLEDLGRALGSSTAPVLGATAGLDSCTVAVALAELGIPFTAFTFDFGGEGGDVAGARHVARELGVPHASPEPAWWADAEGGIDRLLAESAWADGCREAGYGSVRWPAEMDRWIVGLGAETGRAFYWTPYGRRYPEPDTATLERVLRLIFEPRLVGAREEQLLSVRENYRRYLAEARDWGHGGWSALDVIYANQRVRRWGRAQLPRNGVPPVAAFAGAKMSRALASLPLGDRLASEWQRRFISSRQPRLAGHVAFDQSRGRAASSPLFMRLAIHRARFLRRRLRLPPRTVRRSARPWIESPEWRARPAYVSWLLDDVLAGPLLVDSLGERWVGELRRRVLAGEHEANRTARLAGGAVALEQSLKSALAPTKPSRDE